MDDTLPPLGGTQPVEKERPVFAEAHHVVVAPTTRLHITSTFVKVLLQAVQDGDDHVIVDSCSYTDPTSDAEVRLVIKRARPRSQNERT